MHRILIQYHLIHKGHYSESVLAVENWYQHIPEREMWEREKRRPIPERERDVGEREEETLGGREKRRNEEEDKVSVKGRPGRFVSKYGGMTQQRRKRGGRGF